MASGKNDRKDASTVASTDASAVETRDQTAKLDPQRSPAASSNVPTTAAGVAASGSTRGSSASPHAPNESASNTERRAAEAQLVTLLRGQTSLAHFLDITAADLARLDQLGRQRLAEGRAIEAVRIYEGLVALAPVESQFSESLRGARQQWRRQIDKPEPSSN